MSHISVDMSMDPSRGPTFGHHLMDFANMLKAFIGSNYLAIAFAFRQSGIILGVIGLIMIATLTAHCCHLLVKCKYHTIRHLLSNMQHSKSSDMQLQGNKPRKEFNASDDSQTSSSDDGSGDESDEDHDAVHKKLLQNLNYGDIGRLCMGRVGVMLVNSAVLVTQFGFCVGYYIFVGNTIHSMFPLYNCSVSVVNNSMVNRTIQQCFEVKHLNSLNSVHVDMDDMSETLPGVLRNRRVLSSLDQESGFPGHLGNGTVTTTPTLESFVTFLESDNVSVLHAVSNITSHHATALDNVSHTDEPQADSKTVHSGHTADDDPSSKVSDVTKSGHTTDLVNTSSADRDNDITHSSHAIGLNNTSSKVSDVTKSGHITGLDNSSNKVHVTFSGRTSTAKSPTDAGSNRTMPASDTQNIPIRVTVPASDTHNIMTTTATPNATASENPPSPTVSNVNTTLTDMTVRTSASPVNMTRWTLLRGKHIPDLRLLVLLPVVIFVPMMLIRNLRHMGFISVIANTSILLGCVEVLIFLTSGFSLSSTFTWANWRDIPIFFGMVTSAFEGIGTILPIESSMEGNRHNFIKFLYGAVAVLTLVLGCFGVLGYLSFGDDIEQMINANIPTSHWLGIAVNACLCVGVLLTFPLMMYPVVEMAELYLFGDGRLCGPKPEKTKTKDNRSLLPKKEKTNMLPVAEKVSANVPTSKRNLLRIFIVVCAGGIAIMLRNYFAYISAFVGALGSTMLAYILPCLFHLKLCWKHISIYTKVKDIIIIIIGVCCGVAGMYAVLLEIFSSLKT